MRAERKREKRRKEAREGKVKGGVYCGEVGSESGILERCRARE